jgi:hypothetical protein
MPQGGLCRAVAAEARRPAPAPWLAVQRVHEWVMERGVVRGRRSPRAENG